jgi:hypothetical protein
MRIVSRVSEGLLISFLRNYESLEHSCAECRTQAESGDSFPYSAQSVAAFRE